MMNYDDLTRIMVQCTSSTSSNGRPYEIYPSPTTDRGHINAFDILDISRHSPHSYASVLYLVHATNYNIPIEDRSGYQ